MAAANERVAAAEAASKSASTAAVRAAQSEKETLAARLKTAQREIEEQHTRHAQEMDHVEVCGRLCGVDVPGRLQPHESDDCR